MADVLLGVFALMLAFEGLLPFLNPGTWCEGLERGTRMTDRQIRFFGLTSIAIGLLLLVLWR